MINIVLLLLTAAGLERLEDLGPHHIHHGVGGAVFKHYDEMYPLIVPGWVQEGTTVPDHWKTAWGRADANAW
ncbi:MAG: hypothetical protein GY732_23430 [Gammaproteobacteria bacterium]|nr:hypothetical protein [Gammaproteobacteria bacterium]